jgi:serine/threonine protein kinase/tetratricopeptide (TPR) repeat protein
MKRRFQSATGQAAESSDQQKVSSQPRVCPRCGTRLEENDPAQLCSVCLLRFAIEFPDGDDPSEAGSNPPTDGLKPALPERDYGHFRILLKEDGTLFELGRGAMGVTYKAVDTSLERLVALKVISPQWVAEEQTRSRFVREARAAASLRHQNIASVFHLGSAASRYFYAMEFVEGSTLEQIINSSGSLATPLALEIATQVAHALAAAHEHGIVHRDIKPANLMFSQKSNGHCSVKVIDFGLVKMAHNVSQDSLETTPGTFLGTPQYASPEQLREGKADIRSDIYSLGVTLWEMLTGETPFKGTPGEVMDQHLHARLPFKRIQHLPQPVFYLLSNMLEKDPARRPQTPEELLAILRTVTAGSTEIRGRLPLARPLRSLKAVVRRRRILLVTMGLLCLIALGAISYFAHRSFFPTGPPARSVAVLPFENIGSAPDEVHFGDGLTSEVIFQLSTIKDLLVISRGGVSDYKNVPGGTHKTLRQIGSELGVRAILESSVQRMENRVRLVTVLYEAQTGKRLWGNSYDREMRDIFAIQRDLAEQIATALHASLSEQNKGRLEKAPTTNVAAYEVYLRGRALYELDRTESNERAVNLFKQAIEQDPNFALAHTALADCYVERVVSFGGERFWLDSAVDLCRQAIRIDPSQVRGYTQLGRALYWKGDEAEVRQLMAKALELAPNDERAVAHAARDLLEQRRFDESYAQGRKLFLINPRDPYAASGLADLCAGLNDKDLAEKWARTAIGLTEDPLQRQRQEGDLLVLRKDYTAALDHLKKLPMELSHLGIPVSDLVFYLTFRLARWEELQALATTKLTNAPDDVWSLLYLAVVDQRTGRSNEALQKAQRAIEVLETRTPILGPSYFNSWLLACAYRLQGDRTKAYSHLAAFLAKGDLVQLPLGRDQPWFDLFSQDSEFQQIMADMDRRHQIARARIHEIEKRGPGSLL